MASEAGMLITQDEMRAWGLMPRPIYATNATGDGGETGGHDLVQLGLGKMGNERLDKHSRFSLSDEGRGGRDNSFSTRHAHAPEEEDGELADEPLEHTPVVQKLDESHEEDDGRNDTSEEPVQLRHRVVSQENHTIVCEVEQLAR